MRISTGLLGWRGQAHSESPPRATLFTQRKAAEQPQRERTSEAWRRKGSLQRVHLEMWRADFPEVVHRKIHFCKRLISHDSAPLQI